MNGFGVLEFLRVLIMVSFWEFGSDFVVVRVGLRVCFWSLGILAFSDCLFSVALA